jgi:ribosomal protein S18 acetylase RimI-like enzyme
MNQRSASIQIDIAQATPDDVPGMQEVFYRGWLATYPNARHGITVEDIEDLLKDRNLDERVAKRREQAANPPAGETTLVAKLDGNVVGVCRLNAYPDKNQLQAIYVLPEHHGHGIGTKLWQEGQQYLDPRQPTFVEVATYNQQAIGFYKTLGFADTGRRMSNPRFTMKSGAVIPELEMKREPRNESV